MRAVFLRMCVGFGLFILPLLAAGQEIPAVNPGDPLKEVLERLGRPQGRISRGAVTTFYYDRGTVEFVDGKVSKAFLVTPEEARIQTEDREKTEMEQRQQAEARRKSLLEEGQRELARLRDDKEFAGRSAADRVAFWQDFIRRYPDVDAGGELAKVRGDSENEATQKARQEELQELKDRIREIEDRFVKLDADYAASLTHWKRNEIDAERRKLQTEKKSIEERITVLEPK